MVLICGEGHRCDRHNITLHGYPCHACEEEHWRTRPKSLAVLRAKWTTSTPSKLRKATQQDALDRAAYDGPHEPVVERAGESGPVSRWWNVLCTEGCGWSHYWLPSRRAADAAAAHLEDRA